MYSRPKRQAAIKIFKIYQEKFADKEKMPTFAIPNEKKTFEATNSRIAQLVRASDC